ncbi:acetylgalactosamine-6-sulfatase [Seminavis robusta]|uniref:Acetylgalactosamine-6-sulfatase n=1 Tax=Seminavis robusta TaxID=568900 RepID=A0A9N8DFH0_9STRA|nr:acetylgalactosamine-6-sulfatase [Seminavis robusta]|eukprot:Sro67_g037730.1 acetylgalactosamine-6-sulfatase (557) ;mRNA; r:107262-108932
MNTTPSLPSFLFLLADDIGWADFSYNNGTALTPNIDAWAKEKSSLLMQDFHSGGTVCSPTRATVLTGRHHFRDCVDFVYGCSDMSLCVPNFEFAPSHTFTVGDAVRMAHPEEYGDYGGVYFAGKWHLGSFFNDSEAYGGKCSSPLNHGFSKMNATVEVAPTATANCQCKPEWQKDCQFGHYHEQKYCYSSEKFNGKCCYNYWWDDPLSAHGVANLTWPTPADDSLYLADAFSRYIAERAQQQKPFLAQISFHNCHIPFIAVKAAKESCARGETCRPPDPGSPPYTDKELDYYGCLTELDNAVGKVLQALKKHGYYDNTMIWFASDNGPERVCPPDGICKKASTDPQRPAEGPGSAGPLRGRKRDIYEGGHRVAGIVSFPPLVQGQGGKETWETVVTFDFLPTIMELLYQNRPPSQQSWAMDGRSIVPLLKNPGTFQWNNTKEGPRSFGIGFFDPKLVKSNGWGYRWGKWKYVQGSASCKREDCQKPQLFDLESDLGERHNLAEVKPTVLSHLQEEFRKWHASIMKSRREESKCQKTDLLPLPAFMSEQSSEVPEKS